MSKEGGGCLDFEIFGANMSGNEIGCGPDMLAVRTLFLVRHPWNNFLLVTMLCANSLK